MSIKNKDRDILNVVKLIEVYKHNLQKLRDSGWDSLFGQVSTFCSKHYIDVLYMDDLLLIPWRSHYKAQEIKSLHWYWVELFYVVLDMQLQELNNWFNESNIESLIYLACLCPSDLFVTFDKEKLLWLAEFYPKKISTKYLIALELQLDVYITYLKGQWIRQKMDKVYLLVYLLVTLALILFVATITIEKYFLDMNFVKNWIRNLMGDQWLILVVYIEKDVFTCIENEAII